MVEACINRIVTRVPSHDVHEAFHDFGRHMMHGDNRRLALLSRMAERSGLPERLMLSGAPGAGGCAMTFGPGLAVETMRFRMAA